MSEINESPAANTSGFRGFNMGETITMAPLVVRGKVLVGNSGGEMGVRGWLTAVDSKTGNIAWRAYSTGPDAECLIGPEFHPFYASDRGKDLGVATWPPDQWKIGGGTVWGFVSYDLESNLIYYGTGNPGVWNAEMRPGDNKWSCGVFARNPDTGQAQWYYQWSPHDLWDHDGINESMVLDLPVGGGAPRKVIVHSGRNGFMYILDRKTGEVLSADAFIPHETAAFGVDMKTGRLIENEAKSPATGRVVRDISPIAPGAKDWQPSAYSHMTGYLYLPYQNMAMDYEGTEVNYIAGTPYVGANVKMYAGPGGNRGAFMAWDLIARKPVWTVKEDFPVWSGAVVTAGDVVFYGTMEGWFKALDARTGQLALEVQDGLGHHRPADGFQGARREAIRGDPVGGRGLDLDPRDGTAALGFVNAMKDLKNVTQKGGMRYVFALP